MGRLAMLNLVLRLLSLVGKVVSIIHFLSATSDNNNKNCDNNVAFDFNVKPQFTFNKFYAYRYTVAVNGIGILYSFAQIVSAVVQGKSGDHSNQGLVKFNLYGDKVVSILLGTGVAAGFGLTLDLKHLPCSTVITGRFLNRMAVACSYSLGGFVSTAATSFTSVKIFESSLGPDAENGSNSGGGHGGQGGPGGGHGGQGGHDGGHGGKGGDDSDGGGGNGGQGGDDSTGGGGNGSQGGNDSTGGGGNGDQGGGDSTGGGGNGGEGGGDSIGGGGNGGQGSDDSTGGGGNGGVVGCGDGYPGGFVCPESSICFSGTFGESGICTFCRDLRLRSLY